jgi:hypothetical protein
MLGTYISPGGWGPTIVGSILFGNLMLTAAIFSGTGNGSFARTAEIRRSMTSPPYRGWLKNSSGDGCPVN